ncbi:MAG: hypothetical protein J6K77_05230 [Ruminococcus sp.]|nr:hypothetical protein [Ruminococcus sp.]
MKTLYKMSPLIYGAFGSLGLLCYVKVFCMLDYRPSEHPYAHPFCLIAGIISLIICVVVFWLDIAKFIDEERKLRRLLITASITVISFIVFIFIWSWMWEAASKFIKYMKW